MVIITLLVAAFLASYYYVWPVYVLPLVQKTQPIGELKLAFRPFYNPPCLQTARGPIGRHGPSVRSRAAAVAGKRNIATVPIHPPRMVAKSAMAKECTI